jgi:uncharacterized protein
MRRAAAFAMLCALPLAVAGCGSTPASSFYTLTAIPGAAVAPSDVSVAVGPVTVPGAIDRPQMVVTTGPNQVRLDEFRRWASPLQNDIARVVAEDLAAILGTPRVTMTPQTLTVPDYRVAIEVQAFELALGEAATLDTVWTVTRVRDIKSQTGRTTVREAAAGNSYEALAAAQSRALARLSQDIAEVVRALGRSAP